MRKQTHVLGVPFDAVTMEEAIRSFTVEGAYASFAEDRRGRLLPGYAAED